MNKIINSALAAFALLSYQPTFAEEPMFDALHLKHLVIEPTLQSMEDKFPGAANPAAVHLLVGIAFHESLGGTYLKQIGGGPARGIYQIEPDTDTDIWINYLDLTKPARLAYMNKLVGNRHDKRKQLLITDLEYQTVIARLKFYRKSFKKFYDVATWEWPDPDDIPALAKLWNDIYNANDEYGTDEQFINDFPKEVL